MKLTKQVNAGSDFQTDTPAGVPPSRMEMSWLGDGFLRCLPLFSFRRCGRQHSLRAGAGGSASFDSRPKPETAASVRTGNAGAGESVPVCPVSERVCVRTCVHNNADVCFQEFCGLCGSQPEQLQRGPLHCSQFTDGTREGTR